MIIDRQAQLRARFICRTWLPPSKNGRSKEMHDKTGYARNLAGPADRRQISTPS